MRKRETKAKENAKGNEPLPHGWKRNEGKPFGTTPNFPLFENHTTLKLGMVKEVVGNFDSNDREDFPKDNNFT